MSPTYRWPRPAVAVDTAVFAVDRGALKILLVERGRPPFRGLWALPGGFLNLDEELADGARRELAEETGLVARPIAEVGTFGAIGRDPRGRVLSVVFLALHRGAPAPVQGGDDAAHAAWRPVRRLPRMAFDHARCVRRARDRLRELALQAPLPMDLLRRGWSLDELHRTWAAMTGQRIGTAGLRRALLRTGVAREDGRGPDGTARYRFAPRATVARHWPVLAHTALRER
ncbi:MAG: NUDIX hydrolase [Planctomycetota bacterium]